MNGEGLDWGFSEKLTLGVRNPLTEEGYPVPDLNELKQLLYGNEDLREQILDREERGKSKV